MHPITGRLKISSVTFFLFFLWMPLAGGSLITLHIKDMNDIPITQAAAGIPFLIELSLKECGNQSIVLPGLEQFEILGKQSHCTVINNAVTARQVYKVCSHKEGIFTLGPASIPWENKRINVPELQFKVGLQQEYQVSHYSQARKTSKREPASPLLIIEPTQSHGVVGEKIDIIITFYTPHTTLQPHHPILQNPKNGHFGPLTQNARGSKEYNGTQYDYSEWKTTYIPTQDGTHIIPACALDYHEPLSPSASPWSQFFSLWNVQPKNHRIYSNALKMTIDPLPDYPKPIHAVGLFTRFTLHSPRSTLPAGDAYTVTLNLEGNGSFDTITLTPHFPSAFRTYFSGDSVQQPAVPLTPYTVKKWNYILQGLTEGHWEIPSQTFVYFDTQKRSVCELTTDPCTITITPSTAPINTLFPETKQDNPVPTSTLAGEPEKISLWDSHHYSTPSPYTRHTQIPWGIWFFLLFLPFICIIIYSSQEKAFSLFDKVRYYLRKRYAFFIARHALKKATYYGEYKKIYPILAQFFSDRYSNTPSLPLSHDDMQKIMVPGDFLCSDNDYNPLLYFSHCIELFFTDRITTAHERDNLFRDAYRFLAYMERQT